MDLFRIKILLFTNVSSVSSGCSPITQTGKSITDILQRKRIDFIKFYF